MGVGFQKPLWAVFLVVKEPTDRLVGPRTRVGGFFRYKGGLKMAAASPRCWGRGAVSYFAVALLRRLAAAILGGRAGLARRQRHKMAEGAARRRRPGPRLARPRGAGGNSRAYAVGRLSPGKTG